MPQFSITQPADIGDTRILTSSDTHHIRDVLRYAPGKILTLTDKKQNRYTGRLSHFSKEGAVVEIISKEKLKVAPQKLEMACSLPKIDAWEQVLQKCVELGVSTLTPVITSRTVVKVSNDSKQERWQRIVDAAHKQCGRVDEMILNPLHSWEDLLQKISTLPTFHKILFWEQATAPIKSYFETHEPASVFAMIGPEGGFSETEAQQAMQAGCISLSLGSRILRVDTAILSAVSIIQYELSL